MVGSSSSPATAQLVPLRLPASTKRLLLDQAMLQSSTNLWPKLGGGGQFIDLADLLPDSINAKRLNRKPFWKESYWYQEPRSGSLEQYSSHRHSNRSLPNLLNGSFNCYSFPSRWKDLNQYKLLIIQTVKHFSEKSWLNYDIAFRKEQLLQHLLTGLV